MATTPAQIHKDIKDSARNRIAHIGLLKKTHQGRIFWFSIIHMSIADIIQTVPQTEKMKRAKTYLVLGLSISPILDRKGGGLSGFLRALHTVLSEFETFASRDPLPLSSPLSSFASNKKLKKTLFIRTLEDFSSLQIPNFAFNPDYSETFLTLLELLLQVYECLISLLPFPSPTESRSDVLNISVYDSFQKVDGKLKRILGTVQRELDTCARNKVSSEVNGVLNSLVI